MNVPPFFDRNNYAFWKVRIRAFLCSIDDTIWDAVKASWTRLDAAKSTWNKAALAAANANSKFNLGEKTEDSKIVRKILRSLPESFHAKVTAIEESTDLDDIKVQELIGSLQTYELSLPNQRKSKSLALKTVNERVDVHDSSDDDVIEKDITYLAKNFRKFLKFKNNGKFGDKGKIKSSGKEKREFKKKDGKESQSTQVSLVLNATGMDTLRKNVRII